MKIVDNMTSRERIGAARTTVVLEGSVALVQVIIAMKTGHVGNWLVAMLAIALGAISWVIFMPEEDNG